MRIDFGIKAIFILLILTLCAIFLHRSGALIISKNLFENNTILGFYKVDVGGTQSFLDDSQGYYISRCHIDTFVEAYAHCGFVLKFSDTDEQGINLSHYENIKIEASVEGPDKSIPIRFILRNFNDNYSKVDEYESLKYNALEYNPNDVPQVASAPLSAFQVERWWIKQRDIPFDEAQPEFTNIVELELVTGALKETGTYVLTLKQATFSGNLISESSLLKLVMVAWLMIILIISFHQHSQLEKISNTDSLTGLLNRRGIIKLFENKRLNIFSKQKLTMFYFDIDDFKSINDTMGHLIGDELLINFANNIKQLITRETKKKSLFSRLSGDEFALILFDFDKQQSCELAETIISEVAKPIRLSSCEFTVHASIGIASKNSQVSTFQELMGHADAAMYQAKKLGKNQYKYYDKEVEEAVYLRKKLAEHVHKAVNEGMFNLLFMPIVDTNTRTIERAEVLIRSDYPPLKKAGPAEFIPVAEEYGIIEKIDLWVLESVCKIIQENTKTFSRYSEFKICVNISSVELHNKQFVEQVKLLLKKYAINPRFIEIEITETSLVSTDQMSCDVLTELNELGFSLALDDFGTGYTAFSQLVNYPIHCLKIDRSFVSEIGNKTKDGAIVINAILSMAKSYKLETIAEGIETDEQYQYLKQHGCMMMQGYLFSKPMPWDDIHQFIL
ncbi:putative bifunctional diguanylate cyclase/phosphodiesterase [Agaribacter flavus]|uniref:Bifunctional diguanylate cyclase/phosphodiesterase n=1 Tax=Agaribacter flavus TaxID=1902781 RepID=A0ABV7FN88_9ALTE